MGTIALPVGHSPFTNPRTVFAAICLFSIALVAGTAVLAASVLRSAIREDALRSAAAQAAIFGELALEADEFAGGQLTGEAKQDLTGDLAQTAIVYGLVVWSRGPRLEFDYDEALSSHSDTPREELMRAFDGEVLSRVSDTRITKPGSVEDGERVIDVFVPIRPGMRGRAVAVLDVHLSYGPTRREIDRSTARVYRLLAGAGLLLFLALVPNLLRASRTLAEFYRVRNRPLCRRLERAMRRRELVLHYQPKLRLETSTVPCVEALLRWEDPKRGLVPPGDFLPQAEPMPVMREITMYVVDVAAAQSAEWARSGVDLGIAVNLSPTILGDRSLPDKIVACVRRHGVDPADITLELTETAAMESADDEVLVRLRDYGFKLSIDDFGTGRSSLSRLDRLPLAELKIDRAFIAPLADGGSTAVVATMLALAGQLELMTVAEGVESEEVADLLKALGCDFAQGFYLTKALPPGELIAWLVTHARVPTR